LDCSRWARSRDGRARAPRLAGLTLLDRFPLVQRFTGRVDRRVAEDVGMPTDHLVAQSLEQAGHRELPELPRQLGVEDDLKQEVAELLFDRARVAALDGLDHLVRLFEEKGLERRPRLLTIPRTAVGST
jgi:hypothetical protein